MIFLDSFVGKIYSKSSNQLIASTAAQHLMKRSMPSFQSLPTSNHLSKPNTLSTPSCFLAEVYKLVYADKGKKH